MRFHLLILIAVITSTYYPGKCAIVPAQQVDPNAVVGSPEHIASLLQDGNRFRRDAYGRGYHRGQTQSQYLNFGSTQNEGKAEAEATQHGTRAYVAGSNGMGQAQSQSAGGDCGDCVGGATGSGLYSGSLDGNRPDPLLYPGSNGRTGIPVDAHGHPIVDKLQLPDGRRWPDSRPEGVSGDVHGPGGTQSVYRPGMGSVTYTGSGQGDLSPGQYQPGGNGSPVGGSFPGTGGVDVSGRPTGQLQPGYSPGGAQGGTSTGNGVSSGSGLSGPDVHRALPGGGTPGSLRPGYSPTDDHITDRGALQHPGHGPGHLGDGRITVNGVPGIPSGTEYRPGGPGVSRGNGYGPGQSVSQAGSPDYDSKVSTIPGQGPSISLGPTGVPGMGYQPGSSSGTTHQPGQGLDGVSSNVFPHGTGGAAAVQNGGSIPTGYRPGKGNIGGPGQISTGHRQNGITGGAGQGNGYVPSTPGHGVGGAEVILGPPGTLPGTGSGDATLWTPTGVSTGSPTILCLTISCPGGATPQISAQYLPSKPGQLVQNGAGTGAGLGTYPGGARPGVGPDGTGGQYQPGATGPYPSGGQYPGGEGTGGTGTSAGQYPGGTGQHPPGQYPGGTGQYPGGSGQYPGGTGQYPGGSGQYPGGTGQYPGGSGQYPGGTGQYPGGSGQYPGGTGQYPGGSGQYPGGTGKFPGEIGQYPGGIGQYPGGTGQYPGGTGQYPGGTGQYPSQGKINGVGPGTYPGGARPGVGPDGTGGQHQPGATGPYPSGGQYPGGVGTGGTGAGAVQYPGGIGQYPGGTGQYPGGTGQHLPGQYPGGTGQYPSQGKINGAGPGTYPGEAKPGVGPDGTGGQHQPGATGPYQSGGHYPGGVGSGGTATGAGQYPGGTGQYPGGTGQHPGGAGQYPGSPSTGGVGGTGTGGDGSDSYPGGVVYPHYPSSTGSVPVTGHHPGEHVAGQYPNGAGGVSGGRYPGGVSSGQYPGGVGGGQYPGVVGGGQYPGGVGGGQYPGGAGGDQYPGEVGGGQYPGRVGGGQYPGGVGGGQYPGGVGGGQYPGGIGAGQYPGGIGAGQYPGGVGGGQHVGTGGVGTSIYPGGYIPGGGLLQTGQHSVSGVGEDDDAFSQAETAVKNGEATASAQGKRHGGTAQTQVSGSYTTGGSFSANAQTSDKDRAAQAQVTGSKDGAMSSAQGNGGAAKSQSQVAVNEKTGGTSASSQSGGVNHESQSEVQANEKGGLADAQASGPGQTSSQAQIGFRPEGGAPGQHSVFNGGGQASAQASSFSGQSQSQINGNFKYGISYHGAAQGASGTKEQVNQYREQNRALFQTIDQFQRSNRESLPGSNGALNAADLKLRASHQSVSYQLPNNTATGVTAEDEVDEYEDEDEYSDEDYETIPEAKSANTEHKSSNGGADADSELTSVPTAKPIHTFSQVSRDQKQQATVMGTDNFRLMQKQNGRTQYYPSSTTERIPEGFNGKIEDKRNGKTTLATPTQEPKKFTTRFLPSKHHEPNGKHGETDKKPDSYVTVTKSVTGSIDDTRTPPAETKNFASTYYTKSSTCGYFTFSCNIVYGSNGRSKICRPKAPTNGKC